MQVIYINVYLTVAETFSTNLHNPLEAVRLWMANWFKLMTDNLYVKIRSQDYPPLVFTASIHKSILHAIKEFSKMFAVQIAYI